MRLLHHVCSYELSKRLEEVGYPQEGSLFYWNEHDSEAGGSQFVLEDAPLHLGKEEERAMETFAAPLASELGEKLPRMVNGFYFRVERPQDGSWTIDYYEPDNAGDESRFGPFYADTLTECLAKMLIHLAENGLITL